MSTKSNQKRPEFTLEFKQDAAKLVNEKGYAHQQAADSLGISLSAIGRWVRAERGTATASIIKKTVLPLNDQAELVRLRKENECNGQQKPDTCSGSLAVKLPLKFQRSFIIQC